MLRTLHFARQLANVPYTCLTLGILTDETDRYSLDGFAAAEQRVMQVYDAPLA